MILTPFLHLIFSLVFLMLGLSGCFKKDAPAESANFDMGNFQNSCKMDARRLTQILKINVTAEIDCVEKNLQQFVDFVVRREQQYIDKEDLQKFILKFFPNDSAQLLKSMDFLFALNTLMFRDRPRHMSISNLKNIFDLLRLFNQNAVPLAHWYKSIKSDKKNNGRLRPAIMHLLQKLSQDLHALLGRTPGEAGKVDILDLLAQLKISLDLSDAQLDLELIKDHLFVKKILMGGNKANISALELITFFPKLEKTFTLALDSLFGLDFTPSQQKELDLFFLKIIRQASTLFHKAEEDEVLMDHDDLIKIAGELLDKNLSFKVKSIEDTIINLKAKIIGGDPTRYTHKEMVHLIQLAENLFEQFYFNHATYEFFQERMDSPDAVTDLVRPDLPEYREFSRPRVFLLWKEFGSIITDYRLFHSPENLQYYSDGHKRFLYGVNLQATIRFGVEQVFRHYGHAVVDPVTGKTRFMALSKDELRLFLLEIKSAMVQVKLWPRFFERFVGEAMNSSDLFQFKSDGDGVMGPLEASTYVGNIMSSKVLAKKMYTALKVHCDVVDAPTNSFDLDCYRKHFFTTVFDDLNYKGYFQKIHDYYKSTPRSQVMKYLLNLETISREVNDPAIPMSTTDIGRVFSSLANIEGTFLRYDLNHNNVMDRDEIEKGYGVFAQTVIKFAKLKPGQEGFGKSIFLYILKKMKVPKPLQVLTFHLFGNKKNVRAGRAEIGTIMAILAATAGTL